MKYVILFFFALCWGRLSAQNHFNRIYNQDTAYTSSIFYGLCTPIQRTTDGGYIMHFFTGEFNNLDGGGYNAPIMIKTDSALIPQWQTLGIQALALKDSTLFDISDAIDSTSTFEKRNLQGNVIWQKVLNASPASIKVVMPVDINSKIRIIGSYVYADSGTSLYIPVFVDIDSMGNNISADTIVGDTSSFEHLFADDSGYSYFILANISGGGNRKIAKLRPDNTVVWSNILYDAGNYNIAAMVIMPNGDIIVGGNYFRGADTEQIFLIKFSASGNLVWQKTADHACRMTDMKLLPHGSIAIAAGGLPVQAYNYLSEDDIMVIDTSAHVLWARNMAPDRTQWPFYKGLSVPYCKSANDWYFATVTHNPFAATIFNTDSMGIGSCNSVVSSFSFHDTAMITLIPSTIDFAPVAVTLLNVIIPNTITVQSYVDSCDYTLPLSVQHILTPVAITVYPNPAAGIVHLSNLEKGTQVTMYDIAGQQVVNVETQTGETALDVHVTNGYYIIKIASKDNAPVYKKIVVIN